MDRVERFLFLVFCLGFLPMTAEVSHGQDENEAKDDSVERLVIPDDSNEDGYAKVEKFSPQEKQKECKRYNNKFISYYGNVYKVEKCKAREIRSQRVIKRLNARGKKIFVVDRKTIAKLDMGQPIFRDAKTSSLIRGCKDFEGKYITYSYTDVFFVNKCRKRAFPDWASFIDHKKKAKRTKADVLAVTWSEFNNIRTGRDMPSIVDGEHAKLLSGQAGIDVIPLTEACRGLNGKDVSYVDRIYRIENCRKRPYNVRKYLKNRVRRNFKLNELSAEQWLSLPNGSPMVTH